MATNDRFNQMHEDADTTIQSGVSLLKTAVGLSPVAVGIWHGQRKLRSNEALNTPIARATPSQALGRAQGLAARRSQDARAARAAALVDRLQRGLGDSEELRKITSLVDQHKALLHALSVTLEDPASGLDTTAAASLKGDIARLIAESSPESVEELAQKVTRSLLDSGSAETLLRLEDNLSEFSKISGQLQVPDFSIPNSGVAVNKIDVGSLMSSARDRKANPLQMWEERALRLKGILGRNNNYQMDIRTFTENGIQFHQAQIFDRGKWVESVSLDDHGFFRSGQSLNTMYAAPRYAMNVRGAMQHVRSRGLRPGELTIKELMNTGHLTTFSDYTINNIASSMRSDGRINWRQHREQIRTATTHVPRAAMSNGPVGMHIRHQVGLSTNSVFGHSFGSDNLDDMSFIAELGSGTGDFEGGAIGAKNSLTGFGAEKRAVIGLRRGSAFQGLQDTYGKFAVDRFQLPITARESQVIGRTSIVIDRLENLGGAKVGGVFHDFRRNNSIRSAHAALENVTQGWRADAAGGLNKLMVIDFKKGGFIAQSYGDSGMGITGVSHTVSKPVDASILNPAKHGYAASGVLERIAKGKGRAVFTGEELFKEELYLGETGSGRKYLPRKKAIKALELVLDREGISYDKDVIYFKGQQIEKADFLKLFSTAFKGNMENVGQSGIDYIHSQDKRLPGFIQNLNTTLGTDVKYRAGYISSDMASKSTFFFTHQIAGSARLLGISHADLKARAETIGRAGRLGTKGHEIYAQAAFELMKERGISPKNIGMTLAGVFHGAEGYTRGPGGRLQLGKGGISRLQLLRMVREGLGKKGAREAYQAMESGLVSFVETAQVGPGITDRGSSRVGLERRFAQTTYERLVQLGMEGDKAASIVAGIYSKKVDFGRHYALAEQMLNMGRSVSGQRNLIDALAEKGATRLSYSSIGEALDSTSTGKLTDWLRMQKHGAVLDFSGAPANISKPIQEIFGTSSIFMPGQPAYEAASGTQIRVAGGQSKEVSAAYGQLITKFHGILADHATTGGDPLREALGLWRGEAMELMGRSVNNLSRGKVRGSLSSIASSYNLTTGAGFGSRDQKRAVSAVFRQTGASAVFADATLLLSELHSQKNIGADARELAESARMFFTGMEHDIGSKHTAGSGLIRIGGRHPYISAGNAFVTQMFRAVGETGRYGQDSFFDEFKNAQLNVFAGLDEAGEAQFKQMRGEEYMRQLFDKDIRSFRDIAEYGLGEKGMKKSRKFFRTMIDNLDQFTGGQGGGKLIFPRALTDTGLDYGLSMQAYLDMDGDFADALVLNKDASESVRALQRKQVQSPAHLAEELQSRVFKNEVGKKIKEGMASFGSTLSEFKNSVYQDLMKEMGVDQQTGAMDVRLAPLHEAFGNYGQDIREIRLHRDILGALEENVLLKAKKLKVFVPLADRVGGAVEYLMQNANEDAAKNLRDILANEVFHGQETKFAVGELRGSDKNGQWVAGVTQGRSLSTTLDDFVAHALAVAAQAKAGRTILPTSAKAIAGSFGKNPEMFVQALAGSNMEFAGQRAFSDSVQHDLAGLAKAGGQVSSLLGKFDKRMAAPVAIGAAASMFLMGAVGTPGYASEPLIMDGEYVPSQVSDAIAQGSLFASRTPQVTPEQFATSPPRDYGMIDRPINSGFSYMSRSSAYQIRGIVPNGIGLDGALKYMSSATGGSARGSVRINDTRRPITRSYTDRLMGEY